MSELQVTTVSVNTTTNATAIVVGNTVINATGIHLGTGGGVNTSAVSVNSQSYVLTANMNLPTITVGGVTLPGIFESVNVQTFTANGTWTKPSWATDGKELVVAHLCGGGGGGATLAGGGGGAFVYGYFIANNLGPTEPVEVGTGGNGGAAAGSPGGNSSFAGLVAYGGGFATTDSGAAIRYQGGFGGGWLSRGSNTAAGGPLGGNSTIADSTFGGSRGAAEGGVATGNTVYGGGGGGASGVAGQGRSIFGANGGASSGTTGTVPGGGGGGTAGDGARGEVTIYTYRILS